MQTRIEWGNGEKNWLTRAQRLMQDAHFAVEQEIRARRGVPFQFNGTGGIWRRAAVEEAGGWSHDTLSEDLDLVLRTSLKGWHGVFLMEPHVVGELPAKLDDFSAQQSRWSKGFVQVARKLLGPIWSSDWSDEAKFMTTVALGQQLIFPVLAAGIVALVLSAIGHGHLPGFFRFLLWLWFIGMLAVLFGMTFGALAPAEARRPPALPRHGGQCAGPDRLSCCRQRRPDHRRRVRAQDRVQSHAQGRHLMAVVAALALLLAAVFVVCCVLLAAFVGSLLYMVILHHRLKERGLRREEELLVTPLPPDADLPHVVVQIPSFNEGDVLRRGIEAAARLDWPRDKLHIQVLDDSTDETAELARTVVAELKAKDFDIVALQRTDRSGFKGGALHEAMQQTPHSYFAIFDVDYVPEPDFLRVCMRPFFANPNWAFVQARFDFLNPHEKALTEMQMVTLDAHLGIEQATRCWAGHPLPFNGTCGIWQRAAIEAGGGWKGDTVTEDLDLTYRGWVKGWRALFLTSVPVPSCRPTPRPGCASGGAGRTDSATSGCACSRDPEDAGTSRRSAKARPSSHLCMALRSRAAGRRRAPAAGGLLASTSGPVAWRLFFVPWPGPVRCSIFLLAGRHFIRGARFRRLLRRGPAALRPRSGPAGAFATVRSTCS